MTPKKAYIAPIIKPGSIKLSTYANLYSENEKVLVLAKSTSLEIFKVFKDGLSLIDVIRVEDKIKTLLAFNPKRGYPLYDSVLDDLFYTLPDGSAHVIRFRNNQFQFFHESDLDEIDSFNPTYDIQLTQTRELDCWVTIDSPGTVITLVRADGFVRLFFLSGPKRSKKISRNNRNDHVNVTSNSEDSNPNDEKEPLSDHITLPIPPGLEHPIDNDGDTNTTNEEPEKIENCPKTNDQYSFIISPNTELIDEVFAEVVNCKTELSNIEFVTMITSSPKERILAIVHRSNFQQTQTTLLEIKRPSYTNNLVTKVSKTAEDGITKLIQPIPTGGFLSFNENTIYYYDTTALDYKLNCLYYSNEDDIDKSPKEIITFSSYIDANRYIIGSEMGNIYLVGLITDNQENVTNIISHPIAVIPGVNNIIHLSGSYFLTASHLTSSMLIDLDINAINPSLYQQFRNGIDIAPETINPYKIIYQIDNLGPILDFFVREEKSTHSNQIIACTGSGSVKRINSGIQPTEISGLIPLPNIQHMWSYVDNEKNQVLLFFSCIGRTRVFALNTLDQLAASELYRYSSINLQSQTVYFGTLETLGNPVHIDQRTITVLPSNPSFQPIVYQHPSSSLTFSTAGIWKDNIIVATKHTLLLFRYNPDRHSLKLRDELSLQEMNYEISSISYTSNHILVSFWHSPEIRLFVVTPEITQISSCDISKSFALISSAKHNSSFESPYQGIRSVLLKESSYHGSENKNIKSYIGLSDGSVIIFDDHLLRDGKRYSLGPRPISLFLDKNLLFAISDKLSLAVDSDYYFQPILSVTTPRAICKVSNDLFAIGSDKGFQIIRLADLASLQVEEITFRPRFQTSSIPLTIKRLKNNRALVLWDQENRQTLSTIDINKMESIKDFELSSDAQHTTLAVFEKSGSMYCITGGQENEHRKTLFDTNEWEKYTINESVAVNGLASEKIGFVRQYKLAEDGSPISSSMEYLVVNGEVYCMFTSHNRTLMGVQSKVSEHNLLKL